MNAQEQFWSGSFGADYTARNRVDWRARIPFWSHILTRTDARSVFEFGCNAGWNLSAIQAAGFHGSLGGMDVNPVAVRQATAAGVDARLGSAVDLPRMLGETCELVFTAGVLIHIGPDELSRVMTELVRLSCDYVLAVEYESPKEEEVLYRGNAERLWKRPFGDLYQQLGLTLIASGGADGFDRCTYWLLRK